MPQVNVSLSDQHKALITDLVESGQFHNASEVFEEGLRLVEAERNLELLKEQRLRQAVEEGLNDLNRGQFISLNSPDEISCHLRKLGAQASGRVSSSEE